LSTDFDLQEYLTTRLALVDGALDASLVAAAGVPLSLLEGMRYSVFAGGKRIRPVLMMAACEAVGGTALRVLPAACALELIHTYSLIHDDLPAMDDDDFRRGRPTNHRVYGEAGAILAGDALLTEAFLLLSRAQTFPGTAAETVLQVIQTIARAAGSQGMVGGQVVDMASEGQQIDLATLESIHNRKTGALILAALQTGVLLGGGSPQALAAVSGYGRAAGLAFQVADDILDVVGDQALLGKDVGSDQARGKVTYPSLLGLEGARLRARELMEEAMAALQPLGAAAVPLREIARFIVDRSY
jgi:geranylgeranyl diphosphate synthase type II